MFSSGTTTMSAEPGRKSAYSPDIRWRVVWQRIGMELSFRQIALNLNISCSTAQTTFKRFERTGTVSRKEQRCRKELRSLSDTDELHIVGLVLKCPSMYLQELCTEIQHLTGKQVSAPTVCRLLARHGFTRKKIQKVAMQRSITLRAEFMAKMSLYNRDLLVWVDETGSDHRDHARKYGYAIRGQYPLYHRFLGRGSRISSIAAMSTDGIIAVDMHRGSVNSDVFIDFVRGSLIPNMQQYDGIAKSSIVIMDNCSIHRTPEVIQHFREAGIVVIFLPPYSPDLNPIEELFSCIKYYLKRHDELLQAVDDPIPIIKAAFNDVTPDQCAAWITHSGYSL